MGSTSSDEFFDSSKLMVLRHLAAGWVFGLVMTSNQVHGKVRSDVWWTLVDLQTFLNKCGT